MRLIRKDKQHNKAVISSSAIPYSDSRSSCIFRLQENWHQSNRFSAGPDKHTSFDQEPNSVIINQQFILLIIITFLKNLIEITEGQKTSCGTVQVGIDY